MTPRRRETNMAEVQPVRFYKYIALSFLLLTVALLGVIVFMSAKRAVITITTRQQPLEVRTAVVIGQEEGQLTGTVEVASVFLQKTFQPKEGREEPAVAIGKVILYNKADYNQPLVATTRLLTPEGILFRLKDRVVVPALGNIEAEVYADQAGKESEIGPSSFIIPGLSEDKQKLIYAISEKSMTGGWRRVGILGESDWQNANDEFKTELEKIGKEKLSKLHPDLLAVYKLNNLQVTSDKQVGDETGGFTLTGSAEIVGVFYQNDEVKSLADSELRKRLASDNEILSVNDEAMSLVLNSYDASSTIAQAEVVASGLVSLNPESKQLAKTMFFGKNKEEIRRYLLSLDHVQGVEIKFSPAWMLTVPPVADHVSVVVKSVE